MYESFIIKYQTLHSSVLILLDGKNSVEDYDRTRVGIYRVSHNIGSTLFFAGLLASTLPKYKSWVSVKKIRKFATS